MHFTEKASALDKSLMQHKTWHAGMRFLSYICYSICKSGWMNWHSAQSKIMWQTGGIKTFFIHLCAIFEKVSYHVIYFRSQYVDVELMEFV